MSDIYTTSYVHIMVLGWASFAIIGMIYYAVPKMAGRPLHSRRLGSVHFWITNIFVPAGIVFVASLSFYLGSLVQGGTTASQLFSMPVVIVSLILLEGVLVPVGIIAQGLFAYNVYRTMKGYVCSGRAGRPRPGRRRRQQSSIRGTSAHPEARACSRQHRMR